ncbi:hypothetical protein GQ457_09G030520 [Hibiscus cannabinus]
MIKKKTYLFQPFPSISFSLSLSFSPPSITPRVSTAPLEYASPASESNNFQKEIPRLTALDFQNPEAETQTGQDHVLDIGFGIQEREGNSVKVRVLVHDETEDFRNLLKVLGEVEEFYDCIGRIIGIILYYIYRIMVLELLAHNSLQIQSTVHESMEYHFLEIHPPTGCNPSSNTEYASQAAL